MVAMLEFLEVVMIYVAEQRGKVVSVEAKRKAKRYYAPKARRERQ